MTRKSKGLTQEEAKRDAAKQQAWKRGLLRWKLDQTQQLVYDEIKETKSGSHYFNKARRIGGSYLCCVLAIEECLKKPYAKVKYAAPTAKAVRKIITPNIRKILEDAPDDCKPRWINLEQEFRFDNGSTLEVAGCDNQQFENLRGTEADAIFLDEVGFMDELEYVLNDVLAPQVQDTGGRILMCSTPPRSPAHPSYKIAMAHKAAGRYSFKTVWDNPRRTKEQHEAFFLQQAESKGMQLDEFYASTTFRREYMGEFISDSERSVIPEWSAAVENYIVQPCNYNVKGRDRYSSLDIGFKDGMACVFAEYSPSSGRLYIIDEYLEYKKTTDETVAGLAIKEAMLWHENKPKLRFADNNSPQFISDVAQKGLVFTTVKKRPGSKEVMIAKLRDAIKTGYIRIAPKCKRLCMQLKTVIWNAARTEYERDEHGHGDLLDALIYLVWMVRPNGSIRQIEEENGIVHDRSQDVFGAINAAMALNEREQRLADAFSPMDEVFMQNGTGES
jgi:hypothetical protein